MQRLLQRIESDAGSQRCRRSPTDDDVCRLRHRRLRSTCHRGSAAEDSAWREILEYFSSATQIGLTATPRETRYVSNIHYFGEPVYTYSLKEGIRDGFLAPYKVVKIHIDRDVEGYRPEKGQLDRDGEEVEDCIYNVKGYCQIELVTDRMVQ